MRLNDRSYGTLPPRPGNNRVLRELTLSLTGLYGAKACVTDASAHLESFYLIYGGDAGITPSRGHRFVEVDLVRSSGAPTLASCYLVEVLHAAYNCSTEKLIVENVHQFIVLAVVAAQEADALLDTSSEPLLRVLWRPSCPTLQLLLHFFVTFAHTNSLSRAQLRLLPRTRSSGCPYHRA